MRAVVLIVAVLAFAALGFFVMGRLDAALGRSMAVGKPSDRRGHVLRIAFSNPAVVGAVEAALERLCRLHPDVELSLYAAACDAILRQLAAGELDMAFLPAPADEPDPWGKLCVTLPLGAVQGSRCALPILPLEDGAVVQWLTWRKAACDGRAEEFAALLEKEFPARSGSAGANML